MSTLTIEQADELCDDAFHALLNDQPDPEFHLEDTQRATMVQAFEKMVEGLDEDLTDGIDWDVATRSDWDLYSELRMNGVEFERAPQIVMGR